MRNKSAFSTNARSAVGETPAKPRDNTERMPVSFTTSAVVSHKEHVAKGCSASTQHFRNAKVIVP